MKTKENNLNAEFDPYIHITSFVKYVCIYMCVCIYIYIYIYTHIYVCVYIYIHTDIVYNSRGISN